ncbi:hypothetical protein L6R52_36005, partial [Myxococcota bacterium]|nr:hypothetical protein [Myxococcota bacterium]
GASLSPAIAPPAPAVSAPDSVLPAPELATDPPAERAAPTASTAPQTTIGAAPQTTIGAAPEDLAAKSAVPDSSYSEWISGEPGAAPAAPVTVAKAVPVPEAPKRRRIIVRRRS